MKELSIEQKAKRYDEAIRESSKIINHCAGGVNIPECVSVKATIEQIFPELKESEDERIRKWLINLVKGHIEWMEDRIKEQLSNGQFYGRKLNEAKDVIAYLEKQGKQNLANSAKTCKDEQKPAELDENGESILTPFEAELFSMMSDAWQGYQRGEEVNIAAIVKEHSAELLERAYEQKPVEWSEEDRIKCNGAIHLLENLIKEGYFDRDSDDVQVASDLKFACKVLINWLKSLKDRYTWKPSDEQMDELRKYSNNVVLRNLYYSLKKLK